jgi:Domain of unknown function (DUF4430)
LKRAALASLAAAALVSGCGFLPHGKGHATVWVTRNRGSEVVLVKKVPAGISAMDALARVAQVRTRYGGRYVESIGGLAGSLSKRSDWFYFVNGYEADRSAADYKLHDGDVEWWDYRSWRRQTRVPAVVGAFPEPFLHGYDGKTRTATLVVDSASLRSDGQKLANLIHAKKVPREDLAKVNVLFLTERDVPFTATTTDAGAPVRFTIGARAARRLLANPKLARYRYQGLR